MTRREEEVQAVLDTLFISKSIAWEFEQRMWAEAGRKNSMLMKFGVKRPARLSPGWAKREFERVFRPLVQDALHQAEQAREGKKAHDIAPLVAQVVEIQRDQWAIELYVGREVRVIEGFNSHGAAESWIYNRSKQYLIDNNLTARGKIEVIGHRFG
jgi:hypothetical protein